MGPGDSRGHLVEAVEEEEEEEAAEVRRDSGERRS